MKTKWLLLSVVMVFLAACQVKKRDEAQLQTKVDSLTAVVENNEKMAATLYEANSLLDSIDVHRNLLRHSMFEGTSYENFSIRMNELNSYVKRTQNKIHDLESALKTAKQSGSSYNERVKDLKKSLEQSNQEIASLQEQVTKYRNENDNLIKTVNLQQAELDDKLSQIAVQQGEVGRLEARVNEILVQSRNDAADAYFARAEALELVSERTSFLAYRKKNAARQQALDMYRMAVLYGKDEAQTKVDELAKKL